MPLRMPSLLPHDLCHGQSSSRWPPTVAQVWKVAQHRLHQLLLIKKSQNPLRFKKTPFLNGRSGQKHLWPSLITSSELRLACCNETGGVGDDTRRPGNDIKETSSLINSVCLLDVSSPPVMLLDLQMLMLIYWRSSQYFMKEEANCRLTITQTPFYPFQFSQELKNARDQFRMPLNSWSNIYIY